MAKQSVREYLARIEKGLLDTNAGGILGTAYQRSFVGDVLDYWQFLKGCRIVNNLNDPNFQLNEMAVNDKAMRKPVVGTEPSSGDLATFTITPHTATVAPGSIYADVSKHWLEQNIEGQSAEDTISKKLAELFGANWLNLLWNGDTAYDGTADDEAFFQVMDGWLKKFKADSRVHKFDTNGSADYKGVVFPAMIDLLPEKYRFSELYKPTFLMNVADAGDYLDQIAGRATVRGDAALMDGTKEPFKGHPVEAVPFMPQGTVVLTPKKNLVPCIWENMEMYRQYIPRKHAVQFTLDGQYGACYEESPGVVLAYNS